MQEFEIILFYKYVHIANPEKLAEEQRVLQARLGLKGRTIIATEGINATLEGTKANVQEYLKIFLLTHALPPLILNGATARVAHFPKLQ